MGPFAVNAAGEATWDRRFGRAPVRAFGTCEARLTLQSGTGYSTADQTGKSTVYLTPFGRGAKVELYDTTVNQWVARTLAAEVSVAVPSTLFRLFDLFAYWTGSALALETVNWNQSTGTITAATAANPCVVTSNSHGQANDALAGIAAVVGTLGTNANNGLNGKVWTLQNVAANTFECQGSDTSGLAYTSDGTWYSVPNTRATALTTQNGRYVKSGDASRLYLGTGMTHGTSGQTEDSAARRLLWNLYNQKPKKLKAVDTTDSWNYTTAALRPANNRIANRVEFVRGLDEDFVSCLLFSLAFNDSGAFPAVLGGIGLKQTDGLDSDLMGGLGSAAAILPTLAHYEGAPGLGYSYLQWLEYSGAAGTTTWYGDAGTTFVQSGLLGRVWC